MTDSEGRHPSRRLWRRVLGGAVTLAVVVVLGLMRLIGGGGGGEPPGAASGAATPSASPGRRLDCGRFEFPSCSATDVQFDPSFPDAGDFSGGFGGGSCQRRHTPVIFVHGNADHAVSWDSDIVGTVAGRPAPSRSVYDELLSRGYQPCELFGVTFLEATEQRMPQLNYHSPAKYRMILDFVADVQRTTGAAQVDIVSHSLGVSMAMAALTWSDETGHQDAGWSDVRRFVNIAGGVRGLSSCLAVGFANPLATTCGSQNLLDPYVFGFFPSANGWTALSGRHSLAAMPARHPGVAFYTLSAGEHDQVHCSGVPAVGRRCAQGALYLQATNVRAQLDVGAGSTATSLDLDISDGSPFTAQAGDVDGVGHYKARNNTGEIIFQMLDGDCVGLACRGTYAGTVSVVS